MSLNNICVFGMGYIGLPTAAMFASKGISVIGVDIQKNIVETINSGNIHIIEPGLDRMVNSAVSKGFLRASTEPSASDVFFIAVPTPFLPNSNTSDIPLPDISFIEAAADSISKVLKKGDLIILESTSPVGTTEKISRIMAKKRSDLTFPHDNGEDSDIRVAYCPERVLPGKIVEELVSNNRIIGGITNQCSKLAESVYKTFVEGDCIITNSRTAEMIKLTENASRDVGIAFANELSIICDQLDIDIWELIKLSNLHPRVNILQPGPGVGGHCIAVDPWFIASKSPKQSRLIQAARKINDEKPHWVLKKIEAAVSELLKNNRKRSIGDISISCLGIAFKPNIDDLRESPALFIAKSVASMGFKKVFIVEPNIKKLPQGFDGNSSLESTDIAIKDADIIVHLVNHSEFGEINYKVNTSQIHIDACGSLSKNDP